MSGWGSDLGAGAAVYSTQIFGSFSHHLTARDVPWPMSRSCGASDSCGSSENDHLSSELRWHTGQTMQVEEKSSKNQTWDSANITIDTTDKIDQTHTHTHTHTHTIKFHASVLSSHHTGTTQSKAKCRSSMNNPNSGSVERSAGNTEIEA